MLQYFRLYKNLGTEMNNATFDRKTTKLTYAARKNMEPVSNYKKVQKYARKKFSSN